MGNERECTLPNIESYYKAVSCEAGTGINRSKKKNPCVNGYLDIINFNSLNQWEKAELIKK